MDIVLGQTYRSEPVVIGVSGLTFTRDAAANASTVAGANVTWDPSYAEIGTSGIYLFSFVTTALGFHTWAGSSSGGDKVGIAFDVITAAQADPGTAYGWTAARVAKLDLLGTATAVALSPVNTTATVITIERGDDETIAISEPSAGWSSLVGAASVTLNLFNRVNATVLSVAGTVTSTTPGSQAVSFTLSDAQTDALRIGTAAYRFNVKAIIASGDDETLALGTVNVRHGA